MKNSKYLLVIILQIFIIFHMQAQDTTSLDEQVATATSLLPTSDITTSILYDQVPEYFPLRYLDGINMGDSIYLNTDRFKLAYGMIASAYIDSFNGIAIDSMWHLIEEFSEEEMVYFGGMYYNYHTIRGDAVDSGWITTDSTYYYDNTLQDTSLYEQRRFYGMAALKKYAAGPTVTFYFDSSYMFTNIGFDTASMEVDFDNGAGWQDLDLNQDIDIVYSVFDTMKHIKVRMLDTLGQWIYAPSPLYVYAATQTMNGDFPINPDSVIRIGETRTFDPGTPCCDVKEEFDNGKRDIERLKKLCQLRRETPDHLGRNVAMKNGVEIFYWQNDNCQTPCHRKPLIIIEGFDPFELYDYDLLFNNGITDPGLLNMPYFMSKRLSEYINLEDYDIYFINFGYKNNTDYIQNNAQWFKQALNTINELKANCGSIEKNVVIGASMGGLVGRWALSELEAAGIGHETELFVSFDSPLKGANVPIGQQALVHDLRNTKIWNTPLGKLNNGLEGGYRAINYPAAKQMLYYHRTASGSTINTNASTLKQLHSNFQNQFDQLQLSIPHLAISNGSLLNEDQGYAERYHILDERLGIGALASARNQFIQWVSRGITGDPCLTFPPGDNVSQAINEFENQSGLFGGAKIWIDVWTAPGKPNENQVYHKFLVTHGILLTFFSYGYYNVDGLLPIDNAPGGTSRYENTEGNTNNLGFKKTFYCFVPTPSSLGIDVPSNLHTNLEDVNTVLQNNNTIVREYRGAILDNSDNPNGFTNQEHVSLDRNSAVWWRYHTESHGLEDGNGNPLIYLDETFNFGEGPLRAPDDLDPDNLIPRQMSHYIDRSLTVDGDGDIWVCRSARIGFIDNQDMPENEAESFELNIIRGFCGGDQTVIDFETGTSMVLGTTIQGDKTGIVNIEDDSQLHFWENAYLDMTAESKLVITPDAQLWLHPNANAYLNLNSTLIIEGNSNLRVDAGAEVYLDEHSKIIIEENGHLQIESDASVYLNNNSEIIVKSGAQLTIPEDAYLELKEESKIIVEAEAEIVMATMSITDLDGFSRIIGKEGSCIQLEESPLINLDGESSIEIQGSFITDGDIVIEAPNGFLDFHQGSIAFINVRTLGGNFRMNGYSRDNLLIKFHDFSYGLNTNDYNLELYNGKVLIAEQQGYIFTNAQGPNGTFILHNIHFLGQGNIAGGGTPFYDYGEDRALLLRDINELNVNNCIFENVTRGIDLNHSIGGEYRIENTKFQDVFIGFDAEDVDNIMVIDCKFENPQYVTEQATAGMELSEIGNIYIVSTDFVSFRCGIREKYNAARSNIHLLNCTEIVDCYIGLYGDDTYVKMDNSGLFYNKYGIAGVDVELDIASSGVPGDKNVYVTCRPPSGITMQSSQFTEDPDPDNDGPLVVNPPFFHHSDICGWIFSIDNHSSKVPGGGSKINAENNYWSPDPLDWGVDYVIYHDGNQQEVEDIPRFNLTSDPLPGECTVGGGGGEEQLISTSSKMKNPHINIYPNPTEHQLHLNVPYKIHVTVHSIDGQEIYDQMISNGETINTLHWQTGLYIVKVGKEYFKIIKQ